MNIETATTGSGGKQGWWRRLRRQHRRHSTLLAVIACAGASGAGAIGFDLQFQGGIPVTGAGTCSLTLNSRCRFNNVVVGAGNGVYQRDVIVTLTKLNNATLTGAFDNEQPPLGTTSTPAAAAPQFFAPTVLPTQSVANIASWAEFTFDFVTPGGAAPAVGGGTATLPGSFWVSTFDTDGDDGTLQEFAEFVGSTATGLSNPTALTSSTPVDGGIQYQSQTVAQAGISTDNAYKATGLYTDVSSFKLVYGARTGANGSNAGGRLTAFDFFRPDAVLLRPLVDGYKSVKLTADADNSGTVSPGDTLTYTLTYVNTGTAAVTAFQIADTLPANLTVTSAGGQTVRLGGTTSAAARNTAYNGNSSPNLLATGQTLAVGSTVSVDIPVVVGNSVPAQTTLSNQAQAAGTGISSTATDNVDTTTIFASSATSAAGWTTVPSGSVAQTQTAAVSPTTVAVTGSADLTLTKTDGLTTVARGDIANYVITLTNRGPSSANGTVLTDPVAAGLSKTRVVCTAAGGAACPALSVTNLESGVTVATLPSGGSLTLTVSASVTTSSGTVTNNVTATLPSGTVDPTPTGTVSDTDTATQPVSVCSARGGIPGTNLLASQGTFGSVAAGSSVEPPTVRQLSAVSTAASTDYAYNTRAGTSGNTSPEDGEYNISNSTGFRRDGAWYVVQDHTSGTSTGQMMVVNAGTNLGVFYQETVTVNPNTNYELSAWIINLIANNAVTLPNVSIQLDRIGFDDDNNPNTADGAEGQIVYRSGDIPNSSVPIWRNAGYIFNSGAANQITVRFRNNNPGGGGNDLALDDLSFTPCNGLPIGSISGTLYKDRNNNGAFDTAPDSRLGQNIAVALTDSNSGVTSTVYTDANGNYIFTNVPAATYTVGVITVDPDLGGLTPNTPSTAQYTNVVLASGGNIVKQDFGFNAAGLTLTKTVRNCTSDIKANRPCSAAFGTNVAGLPKDILEYCIDYTNTGSDEARNVVLTDSITSPNVKVDLDGYAPGKGISNTLGTTTTLLTSSDADTDIGSLTALQLRLTVGTFARAATGRVCFRVTID